VRCPVSRPASVPSNREPVSTRRLIKREDVVVAGLSAAAMIMSMSNPTGGWALENLPAFEELASAVEQLTLEAGQAIAVEDPSLSISADALDVARKRLARAVALVRSCPMPPDETSARCLQSSLTAFEKLSTVDELDELGAGFGTAMDEYLAFMSALATANGLV
jgi:hypothetical protein